MVWPAIIAGGAALAGSLISANQAKKSAGVSTDRLNDVEAFDPSKAYVNYEMYDNPEGFTPEQLYAMQLQNSEYNNINLDPTVRNAQMSALDQLIAMGENKGLSDYDKAMLSQIQSDEAATLRGNMDAITQNAQMRGINNSGLAEAQRLMSAQQSANRSSQRDLDVMANAQQRALEALSMSGTLGGQIRSQDYNQESQRAAAQDAINKANWANAQETLNANVGNRNQANLFNLQNKQSVNQANVDTRNQQTQLNSQVDNQRFANDLAKATGQANAQAQVTNQYNNQANRFQNLAGIGLTVGGESLRNNGSSQNNQTPQVKQTDVWAGSDLTNNDDTYAYA